MTDLPLALVLLAALIHASWNLLAKKSGGDVRFALLISMVAALVWAPLGLTFSWREAPGFGPLQWGLITASGILHVLYLVILLRGYRFGDLSLVYPLARGTGPLMTALTASGLLGETLGAGGWAGVLGIVCGIVVISGGPALGRALRRNAIDAADAVRGSRIRAGIGYGLLTGLFIAAYTVVDGYAVKRAGISPVAMDYLGNLFRLPLTALLILLLRQGQSLAPGGHLRQMWRPALIIGTLSPLAYVLVLYATTLAPLSHVAPMREVSMLFAALLGGSFLGEGHRLPRLLGAACIGAGVVALSLA